VSVGPQPAEGTLDHAPSDDKQISPVFGYGPGYAIDQPDIFHDFKRNGHAGFLAKARKVLAGLVDQEAVGSIRDAAWKPGVDARDGMYNVKRRASVLAELGSRR
jgi:hypothetical protein